MAVLQPLGSNGDSYFEWDQHQWLFDLLDKVLITRAPPPEIKPAWQKKEDETEPRENASGWTAVVMEDDTIFLDVPLMIMLCRPGENHYL